MKTVCPKLSAPCKACPFRRTAAKGYLGTASGDPDSFFWPIWNERLLHTCHKQVDWDRGERPGPTTPLCKGAIDMMANAGKLPRGQRLAELVREATKNPEVFNWPHEFIEHHRNA